LSGFGRENVAAVAERLGSPFRDFSRRKPLAKIPASSANRWQGGSSKFGGFGTISD